MELLTADFKAYFLHIIQAGMRRPILFSTGDGYRPPRGFRAAPMRSASLAKGGANVL